MAATFDQVKAVKRSLEDEYRVRHAAFGKLRGYYHGNYWDQAEKEAGSIASVFRDLLADRADVGPDIKLVNNLLQQVVTKYQTFLSPAPMIRVYVDPPGTQTRRAQANLKERYLYGTWAEGRMPKLLGDVSWYLPLFGQAYMGAFPDLQRNLVRPILRSPEHAFPVPAFDGNGLDAIIFCWKTRESAVKRAFPKYRTRAERRSRTMAMVSGMVSSIRPPTAQSSDPEVEFWEYSDANEWARWADGEKLNGVEHKFGFNLYEDLKFIQVPNEVFGHGAVEQIVNQVEMGNALQSLLFQAVIDNVFPTLVLEDPSKAPEEIDKGAGGIIPLNPGGKAYHLNGNVNMQQGLGMLAENERQVKQGSGMPDVNFGNFNASIVTGKAINELQGAGTGSTVEYVQGVGIGSALVSFNEKAVFMGQEMFRDEKINLHGIQPGTIADLNPRQFALTIKGKELIGSGRNDVVFSPHMSMGEKIVMGLQMSAAGLVSKQWQREQVGIPDSQAMDEEIVAEQVQDAVIGYALQSLDPSNPSATEDAAMAYIDGKPSQTPPMTAPPQPGMTLPEAGAPGLPPSGGPGAAPPPAPPTSVEAPAAPGAGAGVTSIDMAMSALLAIMDIRGRVFLVGEIVDRGETDDTVEIAVTEPDDRQAIRDNVQFEVAFTVIETEPLEEFVEVTPGGDPRTGGAEPDLAALAV